jgi:hypothetical protein
LSEAVGSQPLVKRTLPNVEPILTDCLEILGKRGLYSETHWEIASGAADNVHRIEDIYSPGTVAETTFEIKSCRHLCNVAGWKSGQTGL